MFVEQIGAIHVSARFDWTFPVFLYSPAPKNNLPFIVDSLKLHPDIECVNRTARKEVSDGPRSCNDIDAYRVTATHDRRCPIKGSDNLGRRATKNTRSCA